jgi:hypothetical protein
MLYVLFGPVGSGKSSTAKELQKLTNGIVFAGRDYLRLAKNEHNAWNLFLQSLNDAAGQKGSASACIIYVLASPNDALNIDGATKARFTADIDVLKERFARRTGSTAGPQIERMLRHQSQEFENVVADLTFDTSRGASSSDIALRIFKSSLPNQALL